MRRFPPLWPPQGQQRAFALRQRSSWAIAVVLLPACMTMLVTPASSDTWSFSVPATANIYGAGHAVPPAPEGHGAGVLPPGVTLPSAPDRLLRILSATGVVHYNSSLSDGPDGSPTGLINAPSWGGLAGHRLNRVRVIAGVFLDGTEPADPPPARLLADSLTFRVLTPGLCQLFPIGDGRTGTAVGDTQIFVVPAGATRLFLGFIDSFGGAQPGWYGDNSGSLDMQFSVEPGSVVAAGPAPVRGFEVLAPVGDALRGGARVRYRLPRTATVRVTILDLAGREIRRLGEATTEDAGLRERTWDGRDERGARVRGGIYFARVRTSAGDGVAKLAILP